MIIPFFNITISTDRDYTAKKKRKKERKKERKKKNSGLKVTVRRDSVRQPIPNSSYILPFACTIKETTKKLADTSRGGQLTNESALP